MYTLELNIRSIDARPRTHRSPVALEAVEIPDRAKGGGGVFVLHEGIAFRFSSLMVRHQPNIDYVARFLPQGAQQMFGLRGNYTESHNTCKKRYCTRLSLLRYNMQASSSPLSVTGRNALPQRPHELVAERRNAYRQTRRQRYYVRDCHRIKNIRFTGGCVNRLSYYLVTRSEKQYTLVLLLGPVPCERTGPKD